MNIKILSDSTCDLPQEVLEKYDITLFPLMVIKDGQEYLDDGSITPADIFAHVAAGGDLCSTAARNVAAYQEVFAQYADKYDGVLHFSIGSEFSSTHQNAVLASMEFSNVRVIDTRALCCAQGLVVTRAGELAPSAASLDELVAAVEEYKYKTDGSFVVEKLDYLAKGGRCSSAAALGANLLNLKPCIDLKDGRLVVGKKYRGSFTKCLVSYVKDKLSDREDIDFSNVYLVWTEVSDETLDAVRAAIAEYGRFEKVTETRAGCTVSCHCGPGTLGIMFARK